MRISLNNLTSLSNLKKLSLFLVLLSAFTATLAFAETSPYYPRSSSRLDITGGYQNIHANAPPSICECFNANGAFIGARYWLRPRIGITAEFARGHQDNISSLGQNLTLSTYLVGPHVALPFRRLTPFYEVLVGKAYGSDSYFPTATGYTTSASSFAFAPGGGIDIDLSRHFAVRAIQARYLHTTLPNGSNNQQNHFILSSGLVMRFGRGSR